MYLEFERFPNICNFISCRSDNSTYFYGQFNFLVMQTFSSFSLYMYYNSTYNTGLENHKARDRLTEFKSVLCQTQLYTVWLYSAQTLWLPLSCIIQ